MCTVKCKVNNDYIINKFRILGGKSYDKYDREC